MLQSFSAVLLISAVSAWGFPSPGHLAVERKPVITSKSYGYSTSSYDDCTCEDDHDDHDDHHVSYGGYGHGSYGLGSHSYGGRGGYNHSKPSYGFGHQKRVYVASEPKHNKSHGWGKSSHHHEEPEYETIHIVEKPVAHHGHSYGGYGGHGLGMSHGTYSYGPKNTGYGGHGGFGHGSGLSMSTKHYAGQSLLSGVQNKLSGFGSKKFSGVRGIGSGFGNGLGSSVGGLSGSSLGGGFDRGYGFGKGHGANYLQAHTGVS